MYSRSSESVSNGFGKKKNTPTAALDVLARSLALYDARLVVNSSGGIQS